MILKAAVWFFVRRKVRVKPRASQAMNNHSQAQKTMGLLLSFCSTIACQRSCLHRATRLSIHVAEEAAQWCPHALQCPPAGSGMLMQAKAFL